MGTIKFTLNNHACLALRNMPFSIFCVNRLPIYRSGCLLLILLAFAMSARAADLTSPLPVRNLYPPMMRFFDPTPDSALRSYQQSWQFELTQHYSTVNIIDYQSGVGVLVDMELYVLDPVIRYSLTNILELSLRVPLLLPGSGVLDSPIQSFHNLFGFPDNGRKLRPSNSFAYTFDNGKGARWRGSNRAELGNIELSGRFQLSKRESWALAALMAVKLPTASKTRGWGSGASDLAVGGVVSWHQGDRFAHLEGWLVQPLAKDEPGIHYERYLRGSVTLGYQLFDSTSLIVQAQGGDSPYQTMISALDRSPFLVSFGLRGHLSSGLGGATGLGWTATVVENISQVTTQDISVAVGLSWSVE